MDVFQLAFTFWKASLMSNVERLLQSKLAGRFGSVADLHIGSSNVPFAPDSAICFLVSLCRVAINRATAVLLTTSLCYVHSNTKAEQKLGGPAELE